MFLNHIFEDILIRVTFLHYCLISLAALTKEILESHNYLDRDVRFTASALIPTNIPSGIKVILVTHPRTGD
ncbi:unnamed protein product [Coffea canephora]|uniref:DH200=94 genomic scaffold, scaffold_3494 n=1 Tax=Coffea canephora TaxID=49390 RepID=A0A068VL66_COFCA|nr:unnamed protein product [Coffea canephora]